MKIANVATRQERESSIAYAEAIMSTEVADKGRPRASSFVGIHIFRRLGSFACHLDSLVRGEVLVLVPSVPSIEYIYLHASRAFVRTQCSFI